MKLTGNLWVNLYEALSLRFENRASDPAFAAGEKGRVWVGSTGRVRFNDGTAIYQARDTGVTLVNGDLDAAAAIALSKLATDPLARANHTGTQVASTVSNFDTQVRTSRLDQMATPTLPVALGSQRITGLLDPTSAQDAATRAYVDGVAQGLDAKASVRAATTAALTLTAPGTTLDGVALTAGDRILVKNQAAPAENGIYTWSAGASTLVRATDADVWSELVSAFTFVEEGTTNLDTGWVSTNNVGGTLNTTAVAWTQFSSAGTILAGAALVKTGSTLDVQVDAASIQIATNQLSVKALGVTNAMLAGSIDLATKVTGLLSIANGGTAATTAAAARTSLGAVGKYDNGAVHAAGATIVITAATHGLGAGRGKMITLIEEATGDEYLPENKNTAANGDVTVTFGVSQTLNTWRVVVMA